MGFSILKMILFRLEKPEIKPLTSKLAEDRLYLLSRSQWTQYKNRSLQFDHMAAAKCFHGNLDLCIFSA